MALYPLSDSYSRPIPIPVPGAYYIGSPERNGIGKKWANSETGTNRNGTEYRNPY
jgi:hypothetical protein